VLLVEDDPDLAEVTAEFLSQEGLDVRTALSGRGALEVAPAFRPQLVLCDLNLPDIKGLEVVRELRASPSTAQSCIVILTAMEGMPPTYREPKQLGVDAFISKPITIEAVRTLLEERVRRGPSTHL
jgi:two-component system alkaline phosphatase synthesis response regulator PhoP